MFAFQAQFNDRFLDPAFIAGICESRCDRLLYINLMGVQSLQKCSLYPMDEETRLLYIGLQGAFTDAVEAVFETHVRNCFPNNKDITAVNLLMILKRIISTKARLESEASIGQSGFLSCLPTTVGFIQQDSPRVH